MHYLEIYRCVCVAILKLSWLASTPESKGDMRNCEEVRCLLKPDITQHCPSKRAAHLNQSPFRLWNFAVNDRSADRPLAGLNAHLFRRFYLSNLKLQDLFCGDHTNTHLCYPICAACMQKGFWKMLVSVWWLVCVPGLQTEWRTHRIWLWSDTDGSSGPLQRGFTAQTSRTHSLFPSCISGGNAFLGDVRRCDMVSSLWQPRHPQDHRLKMERFTMINLTCFSNNRIDLDRWLFLCGGLGFWKVLQKQSDFLRTGQYNSAKWHSNKPS